MNCMKCGVEIQEGCVFCDHCLEVMEAHPVRPGTHIHLPKRALEIETPKKPVKKKRAPSPEEQISILKMKLLRLRLTAGQSAAENAARFGTELPAAWRRHAEALPASLVTADEAGIRLTREGFLLSNTLISHIIDE